MLEGPLAVALGKGRSIPVLSEPQNCSTSSYGHSELAVWGCEFQKKCIPLGCSETDEGRSTYHVVSTWPGVGGWGLDSRVSPMAGQWFISNMVITAYRLSQLHPKKKLIKGFFFALESKRPWMKKSAEIIEGRFNLSIYYSTPHSLP